MAQQAKARFSKKDGHWVYVRYQGKRHSISYYKGQISFKNNPDLAKDSARVINAEIENGIFRPERWKRRAKKLFNVEGYSGKWLKSIKQELSAATHYDYSNSFNNHINPNIGPEYIEDLNLEKLTGLLNTINREPKGKKNVMGALKRMMKYAYMNGHINSMPIFPEMRGKNAIVKQGITWITPKDQQQIIHYIRQPHRPIFLFISITGCRPSEARAFRKKDIGHSCINFEVSFGRDGTLKEVKGKKVMPFPLTENLKELFDSMPKTFGPFQFPNPETGRPYSKNINRIFNRAAKKAGINITLNEFGRKSFAMQTLNSGIDRGVVSHLLRHQDPRMIDHYAEFMTEPLKSALDKVQGIETTKFTNRQNQRRNSD